MSATLTAGSAGKIGGASMLDLVIVLTTLLFFLVSWLYVRACDRV